MACPDIRISYSHSIPVKVPKHKSHDVYLVKVQQSMHTSDPYALFVCDNPDDKTGRLYFAHPANETPPEFDQRGTKLCNQDMSLRLGSTTVDKYPGTWDNIQTRLGQFHPTEELTHDLRNAKIVTPGLLELLQTGSIPLNEICNENIVVEVSAEIRKCK